jgi:hypothetical protein
VSTLARLVLPVLVRHAGWCAADVGILAADDTVVAGRSSSVGRAPVRSEA